MPFRALGRTVQVFAASAGSRKLSVTHRNLFPKSRRRCYTLPLAFGAVFTLSGLALRPGILLDADVPAYGRDEFLVDPATSIAFPTKLQIPSKSPLPTFTLVGLGVRTVSFLGIKVYSIGFYADLRNTNLNLSGCATADEKIEYIIRNTACVLRIVPTRSTSYSHLRDGFMRSLQARLTLSRKRGTLSEDEEQAVQSPLRQLKSIFPNTPFNKHTPLDILLTAPSPGQGQPRALIIRDMGSVESDWVATEFVLAYFEGNGLSPPLKKSVVERLDSLQSGQVSKV